MLYSAFDSEVFHSLLSYVDTDGFNGINKNFSSTIVKDSNEFDTSICCDEVGTPLTYLTLEIRSHLTQFPCSSLYP